MSIDTGTFPWATIDNDGITDRYETEQAARDAAEPDERVEYVGPAADFDAQA